MDQIIMEFCHYGSLASYMWNGNSLTEDELCEIASCCLFGLCYLHNRKIIHRVSNWDSQIRNRTSNRTICSSRRLE